MIRFVKHINSIFFLVVLVVAPLLASESTIERSEHVEAQLLSEVVTIQPGKSFTVALRMKMDEHWHTYWRNGADAGLATEITWTLPEGFSAGEIKWPFPEIIDTPPLVTYGFHDQIFLMMEIQAPENIELGKQMRLSAKAEWLECEDVCIPGGVELVLDLEVTEGSAKIDEKWVKAFSDARILLPLEDSGWEFAAIENNGQIMLQGLSPDWFDSDLGDVYFFPYEYGLIDYAAQQKAEFKNGTLSLNLTRPEAAEKMVIEGILVSQNGWRGSGSERSHYIKIESQSEIIEQTGVETSAIGNIFYFLLLAFGGGIILNLMPCVLPVLSLKIMGFVQQASEDKSQAWKHGVVFTLGVLVTFWTLAGSLLILRAGGEQLGWGFQLQEPVFLIFLSALVFLLVFLSLFELHSPMLFLPFQPCQ